MSQMTKRALEASLKKLLLQKPLNKITISDIAEDCGISRMTFYYHFKDIYDLVEWVCVEDAARALAGKKTYDTWQEALRQVRTSHEFVLSFFTRAVNILPSDVLSLYMGAIGIHYIKNLYSQPQTPSGRVFFRHAALNFLAIHKVFRRKFALPDGKIPRPDGILGCEYRF